MRFSPPHNSEIVLTSFVVYQNVPIHYQVCEGEKTSLSVHYLWRLSHDCHVISFFCSMFTSWRSLSAKACIVTLPWTCQTDCFSCNSNSHLYHYFSLASLSRAESTVAAFLHFTMFVYCSQLITMPDSYTGHLLIIDSFL